MSRVSRVLFILLLASAGFYYMRSTQYHQASHTSNIPIIQPITPTNTVFAFDLNQVVIMADIPTIKEILWTMPKKELALFLFNPFNWPDIIKTAYNKPRAEYFFQELVHKYPQLNSYKHIYFDLFLAVTLNDNVVAYIQRLKSAGYACYAFSDMGPKALAALAQKFPLLTTLFNDFFIPPCCTKKTIKLYPEYHDSFKAYIAQKNSSPQQIIFIDNYEPNIIAARKAGIYSILFTSEEDLIKQLLPLKVL